jgi:2-oxo-4-hydroxy-4-carboxy-5-ureidoimidazoline decarboxylase
MTAAPSPRLSLAALERADRTGFVAALGAIFEHSPWVAEAAFEQRPFGSVAALHGAMVGIVRRAGSERQLALIRAHPELAGAPTVPLTQASRQEQGSAGLSSAGAEERARFAELNRRYRETFGFPFVMAVKGRGKAEILAAFAERLAQSPEAEFERALQEIARIAALRLEALVED